MKKNFFVLLVVLLSLLCACTVQSNVPDNPAPPQQNIEEPKNPSPTPYTGTMEGYEYRYENDRDRKWEEDILFLAETYLTKHPLLADSNFYTVTLSFEDGISDEEYAYDNSSYDAELRAEFLSGVNQLIAQIPMLNDVQLPFEIQKLVATLGDAHSSLRTYEACTKRLPVILECIGSDDGYPFYLTAAPAELEEFLYAKLVSVNGISVDEIMLRLTPYISTETEGFAAYYVSTGMSLLVQKETLQVIGVAAEEDTQAQLVFAINGEEFSCEIPFVTQEEYRATEKVDVRLKNCDIPRYRHRKDRNYWFEILHDSTLYIRFYSMVEDPQLPLNNFVRDISVVLRDAGQPMNVVIDFRDNGGGHSLDFQNLVSAINRHMPENVYILIDEASGSAAVEAPYKLWRTVNGAVLFGAPAAQSLQFFGNYATFTTPNFGYTFLVSQRYFVLSPEETNAPLTPEILVWPTLEDYKNGTDTALEYILSQ